MDEKGLAANLDVTLGTPEPESEYILKIVRKYGPPAFKDWRGELSKLNEPFWAALRAFETDTVYSPEDGTFYRYNETSGLYERLTKETLLADFERRIFAAANEWGPAWKNLEQLRSARALDGVIRHFKARTHVVDAFRRPEDWKPIIACQNCVVRIDEETGQPIPESFSPKLRLRHGSPFKYVPGAKCEKFEKHLFGHLDQDDQLLIQKLGGQCLLGYNLCQRITIFDGVGASSKSTLLEVLRRILGPYAGAELRTRLLEERFEIGAIAGAVLLCGSDVPGNFLSRKGADKIKALVGGDLLECEAKGSNQRLRIRGLFNIFITANTILHVSIQGDYKSWDRRIVRIHFPRPYVGQPNPKLADELLSEEGPGILNFYLQGIIELLKDFREVGDLRLSDKHKALTRTLLDESDSLHIFLRSSIEKVPYGQGDGITTEELLGEYHTYCDTRDWNPLKSSELRTRIPDLMHKLFGASQTNNLERFGEKKYRGYRMVKLKIVAPPTEEDWH
jgi:phage/plasmid-associated DNA primase